MNSTTAAKRVAMRGHAVAQRATLISSSSAGRRRLPPAAMMYWATLADQGDVRSRGVAAITRSTSLHVLRLNERQCVAVERRWGGSSAQDRVTRVGQLQRIIGSGPVAVRSRAGAPGPCLRRVVAYGRLDLNCFARAKLAGSARISSRGFIRGFFQEVHMYAVIKTGGKQYRVAAGEKIKVEQIAADVGQEIVIDQVLAVGNGAESEGWHAPGFRRNGHSHGGGTRQARQGHASSRCAVASTTRSARVTVSSSPNCKSAAIAA